MIPRFVLDAWAILALLQGEEPAATQVKERLEQAFRHEALLSCSIINLGEVVYRVGKVKGEEAGWETYRQLRRLPLTVLPATEEAVMAAVTLKMHHAISYADAFAAAAARDQQAVLLTGDPELLRLAPDLAVEPLHRAA